MNNITKGLKVIMEGLSKALGIKGQPEMYNSLFGTDTEQLEEDWNVIYEDFEQATHELNTMGEDLKEVSKEIKQVKNDRLKQFKKQK